MKPAGTPDLRTAVAPRGPGTDTGDRAARRPQVKIATSVSSSVLGAGMLVMPPVVAALAGDNSLLVWSAHIVLGGSVSLMLAVLVRTRAQSTSLSGAVGALLGTWAERAVDGAFAIAFPAGQAAIAWFAATCLLTAANGSQPPRPGANGLLPALGVLVVAVLAALSPWSLPAAVLRIRPWVTGAVGLACAAWGWPAASVMGSHTPLAPSGLSPGGAQWLALTALFFAGVGWEAVTGVVPAAAGPWRTAAGVGLGVAVVAVVYLGLAAVQRLAPGGPTTQGSGPAPLRWVFASATVIVLASYCFTNVRTAARIASRLRPGARGASDQRPAKAVIAAVGIVCCAFACAGAAGDGAVPLLLLGPAAAALTGYGLAAVAAVRRGGPLLRYAGASVLLMLASTAVPAVFFLPDG